MAEGNVHLLVVEKWIIERALMPLHNFKKRGREIQERSKRRKEFRIGISRFALWIVILSFREITICAFKFYDIDRPKKDHIYLQSESKSFEIILQDSIYFEKILSLNIGGAREIKARTVKTNILHKKSLY